MNFPEIEAGPMTTKCYITQYLMPLIYATKDKSCCLRFRNTPHHTHQVEYAFTTSEDKYDFTNVKWKVLQTDLQWEVPSHGEIFGAFMSLGYDCSYYPDKCIIDFSKFIKPKTCVIDEVKIVPQAASSTVQTKTINDFFYSAALQALKEKGDAEIHFFHAAPGKVLCIKPPSAEFLSFTTDLILLVDQRKEVGYEVSYRYGANQEHLVVMTFPLSAAKKMIAELSI